MSVTGNLNTQLIRELIAAGHEITLTLLRTQQVEELADGQKLAMEPLLESQRLSSQHLARLKQKLVGTRANAVPSLMLFSACQSKASIFPYCMAARWDVSFRFCHRAYRCSSVCPSLYSTVRKRLGYMCCNVRVSNPTPIVHGQGNPGPLARRKAGSVQCLNILSNLQANLQRCLCTAGSPTFQAHSA